MNLFAELRRRNVFRIAIAYGAFAWLIVQLVETVLPVFGVSEAVIRTIFIVLAIGFIPALVFSWAYEITPEGLKRETDVDRSRSIAPQTGKKLDKVIILVLGVALAYFAVDKFVLDPARDARMIEEAVTGGIPDNSIAVLPFLNMSRDPDNEFFSDGVPEALAAIEAIGHFRISYWPVELLMLLGEIDQALDHAVRDVEAGAADIRVLWRPHFVAQAGDPRFKRMVGMLDLPAYWDVTSWPDMCRRTGEDFSCDPAFINE